MQNGPTIVEQRLEIAGRELIFETGRIAGLADGAVAVRYGDTMVLSTATSSSEPREGIDFFPLVVDYEERMYAAGKIPGGFIKREGRPSEHAILSARLTDRPIRPLFPEGFRNEVQVVTTVFSTDRQNDPDILSINGASAALTISSIPFDGPVGGVRIGYIGGELVVNPTADELDASSMEVVVAGTRDAIMMVEGECGEVSETVLVEAIALAHEEIKRIVDAQLRLREQAGKPKMTPSLAQRDPAIDEAVKTFVGDRMSAALFQPDKTARSEAIKTLRSEVLDTFTAQAEATGANPSESRKLYSAAFGDLEKETVRQAILNDGYRPDGRTPTEIRPIWTQVGYLPRTHGSAIFTRGQTQAISVATLGSTKDDQMIDGLTLETSKRYMHHYNFPPFSVGETRPMRGPSRRDIGHGALAERALLPVLPPQEDFPYVVRVVSDIVSSNGSTSMASVCGSTLALMDAGVPISAPVAGVAMGLIIGDDGRYTVLTDIQGLEDHLGDMDFKVAGTRQGVTAIQMDIKVQGITTEIMRQALEQAHTGRLFILDRMAETLAAPRERVSDYAPSIVTIKIEPDQIGAVIGPGGKVIRGIQEETGVKIDIEDDGTVFIAGVGPDATAAAVERVRQLTWVPQAGDRLTGQVRTIIPVGAFVQIMPGKDGFVHISQLGSRRVERVEDAVAVGDMVEVVVTEIRSDGKINLSMRGLANDKGLQEGGAAEGGSPEGRGGYDREPRQAREGQDRERRRGSDDRERQ
jgi:polyribonucleotide nucleotidyltransferase